MRTHNRCLHRDPTRRITALAFYFNPSDILVELAAWLSGQKGRHRDRHGLGSKLEALVCVLGKNTSQQFPLFFGLSK